MDAMGGPRFLLPVRLGKKERGKKAKGESAGAAGLDPAAASLAGADGKSGRSPRAAATVRLRQKKKKRKGSGSRDCGPRRRP